ncbi:hypothetical protein BO94DRAFT_531510 [Aspergillus sclerotioniger CBS 115572]|uniref:Uncharacterized protein n=1 Tax=Aspergillus sclerotioniger CBS 115572 TaxID=1450535 RepID=A0A317XA80_9EURO|nr:hypothetical protein BO94DRAFT_531510 [Aspergillus sclerotioniger CBS 115572]PWY94552.1 hypothetical protein BO94DRAFT_531510 [Aspergillus sclerotioniger CBS 115572]
MSTPSTADQVVLDSFEISRLTPVELREETWGWVIYRTTYQSDAAFNRTIDIITFWIKHDVLTNFNYRSAPPSDLAPRHQLWTRHQFTIFEDLTTLDGASIDTVREQFEAWGESLGMRDQWNKYRVCMMIDQEAVDRLSQAVLAEEHNELSVDKCLEDWKRWHVPVIEAFPDLDVGDDYQGWINCSISQLFRLWTLMGDAMSVGRATYMAEDGIY